MFPVTLSMLDHLRSEDMIKFKEEVVGGKTVTIVSYMISSPDLWKLPDATEARGITYDSNGNCICAPFHKFFNVGEKEDMLPENLPFTKLTTILEKRDGSMLTPVWINGKIFWKTKKSFVSDVALEAAQNVPENVTQFSEIALSHGYTPIFEYTSPTCEIVLGYGRYPQFVLLAMRSHRNGEYVSYADLVREASYNNVEVIKAFYYLTYGEIAAQMKTLEDFEGYVLRFETENGTMLAKIKTEWYMRMHRVKTDLRERDVADMCVAETLDDVKSAITQAGLSLEPVEAIELRVAHQIAGVVKQVVGLLALAQLMPDRKTVAIAYRDHPLFPLLMKAYTGQEPNYAGYWEKNFRDQFNLRTIYSNFNNGNDEV